MGSWGTRFPPLLLLKFLCAPCDLKRLILAMLCPTSPLVHDRNMHIRPRCMENDPSCPKKYAQDMFQKQFWRPMERKRKKRAARAFSSRRDVPLCCPRSHSQKNTKLLGKQSGTRRCCRAATHIKRVNSIYWSKPYRGTPGPAFVAPTTTGTTRRPCPPFPAQLFGSSSFDGR